jgi:hypothetical protein
MDSRRMSAVNSPVTVGPVADEHCAPTAAEADGQDREQFLADCPRRNLVGSVGPTLVYLFIGELPSGDTADSGPFKAASSVTA